MAIETETPPAIELTDQELAAGQWLSSRLQRKVSPFEARVAALLAKLYRGIYHIESEIARGKWKRDSVSIVVAHHSFATYDFALLTNLVILCHDRCIRGSIEGGAGPGRIRLFFYPRQRDGDMFSRHPTIEAAIETLRSR